MAAVGAEFGGSWFPSSGVVGFFVLLLLLSIFLTALCSECSRRSFELQESEDKNPSALIRVVKLEGAVVARENPMINEIQNDEKEFNSGEENTVSFTPWRSHLGAPQNHQESVSPEEENPVPFTPWRSHLRAPQRDVNSSAAPDSEHIYHVIEGGRDANGSSPPANHKPREERSSARSAVAEDFSDHDRNSVYARVSKKVRPTTPPVHAPEEVQVEEEEEFSPPLPGRKTEMEG